MLNTVSITRTANIKILSLVEEVHQPFGSKKEVCTSHIQPAHEAAILGPCSRLLTRSAAQPGHVLRAIPARGSDTIVMDSTSITIAFFRQWVNTTCLAWRRFAGGEKVNASYRRCH